MSTYHRQQTTVLALNRMCMECGDLDIDNLLNEEWIKINVMINIVDVYNGIPDHWTGPYPPTGVVDKSEWRQIGLVQN